MEQFLIFLLFILGFIIIVAISSSIHTNTTKFRIEKGKDKGANPLYVVIELLPDRVVIDNSSYILYSNIEKAYVSSSIQEIKILNSLVYGGKRYKQGMVYIFHINYKDKNGFNQTLYYGSTSKIQYNDYKLIADKINSKVGFVEIKEGHKIKEL